ncbi:MAG: Ig-like domain-containing protein, partial [Lachnospiraceae bacterium]|nr:Ig-like domain-containing protein [Lachnospiraceae bacterium]
PENPEPENPKSENPTPENPQQDNQISKEAKAVFNAKSIKMQVKKSTTGLQIAEKIPADDTIVKWSSSKPTVVKVNQKGKITAKKVGKAVITVTMASGASASCTVKVQKKPVATTKLILPEKKITMKKGTKYKVLYTRLPFTASDHVKITSSNKKVIKVLKNSMIRAMKKKGTAYITVTAGKKKQKMKVVVR